tara:strand:- start:621 stop:785 length:165 start_codon:yes stop_codon:yes gene_type:complete
MSKIDIPFQVKEQLYSNEEIRKKDAAMLVALQRIANSLEDIQAKLDSKTSSKSK